MLIVPFAQQRSGLAIPALVGGDGVVLLVGGALIAIGLLGWVWSRRAGRGKTRLAEEKKSKNQRAAANGQSLDPHGH